MRTSEKPEKTMSEPFHIITITTYDADDAKMENPKAETKGRVENSSIESIQSANRWMYESIISNKVQCIFGFDKS